MQLELEELDFDSLQNLTDEPLPTFEPIPGQPAFMPPADLMSHGPVTGTLPESLPDVELASKNTDLKEEEVHLVTMSGLEELDAFPSDFQLPEPPAPHPVTAPNIDPNTDDHDLLIAASLAAIAGAGIAAHAISKPTHDVPTPAPQAVASSALPAPTMGPEADHHDLLSPASLDTVAGAGIAAQAISEPTHDIPTPAPQAAASSALPAATGQAPAAPGQALSSEQARALVQALVADPVLVDLLVKAVVARMGDQVLREIAWEVMPDLAGRLQR
jgi:hypothetical protein